VRVAAEITNTTRVAIFVALALVLSSCTSEVVGQPVAAGDVLTTGEPGEPRGVDPAFVRNTDFGDIDRLAATVITDVQRYWQETFPTVFGKEWEDLRGGFYSVDTADPAAPAAPCTSKPSDVEGNAFYCPTADIIAWDRTALLPVLRDRFGEAAVMIVLAHEMGHAVQRRSGVAVGGSGQDQERYPTIAVEAMADCYAGAFVKWVTEGKATHLRIERSGLDPALEALVSFRDPVGTSQADEGAHGDAFDRVSAFQDGFEQGSKLCAGMTALNRQFTLRGFTTSDDLANGGNLPFEQMLQEMSTDLNTYFTGEVERLGKRWRQPTLRQTGFTPRCPDTQKDQGPAAFCQANGNIDYAGGGLGDLHAEIGDYATGTLLASRFGLAALAAVDKPLNGEQAQRAITCLAGAYTGVLITRRNGFSLSPGDLDEAMQVLLRFDYAARDAEGNATGTGYERVAAFRIGTLNGFSSCGLG
jgi:predicted metalloprotease